MMNPLKNKTLYYILSRSIVYIAIVVSVFLNFAMADSNEGISALLNELIQGPLMTFLRFVDETCYILGIGLVIAGISKYFTHRRNPQMVPLSTVIVYIILGVTTFLLPFVLYLMNASTNLTFLG